MPLIQPTFASLGMATCGFAGTSGPLSLILIILAVLGILLFRHSERLALVGLGILLVIWLVFGVFWSDDSDEKTTSEHSQAVKAEES